MNDIRRMQQQKQNKSSAGFIGVSIYSGGIQPERFVLFLSLT
jgi:hypothetical protein